jgi:hypothetical protein
MAMKILLSLIIHAEGKAFTISNFSSAKADKWTDG